jgi:hypothetical protein
MIPEYDESTDYHALPRLAWVVVVTPGDLAKTGHNIAQLSCYAARLGIPFYLEHRLMVDDRHFFTARHRSVAKYLRYYQWVFATDADIIVADSGRDVRDYLDDSLDAILNDLRYNEHCACAYFVRNSPGGWEFLRRWVGWADSGYHLNSDNGDLIEMISAGLRPGVPNSPDYSGRASIDDLRSHKEEGCINLDNSWTTYKKFLQCVQEQLRPWSHADDRVPFYDVNLWEFQSAYPTVMLRTWKRLSGFVRWVQPFEPKYDTYPWDLAALPGDMFLHGKHLHGWLNECSAPARIGRTLHRESCGVERSSSCSECPWRMLEKPWLKTRPPHTGPGVLTTEARMSAWRQTKDRDHVSSQHSRSDVRRGTDTLRKQCMKQQFCLAPCIGRLYTCGNISPHNRRLTAFLVDHVTVQGTREDGTG